MALTDSTVRHAQAREKSYKMADSGGLYIQVMPSGGKHWKMKYRFEGREKKAWANIRENPFAMLVIFGTRRVRRSQWV